VKVKKKQKKREKKIDNLTEKSDGAIYIAGQIMTRRSGKIRK
jgi:hypothetical protein